MKSYIKMVVEKKDLSCEQAVNVMNLIMDGVATPAQIASFITAMRMKGETIDEITGFAKVMREKAVNVTTNSEFSLDTCGTGGDGANTFNISTAVAFVAAAAGVTVAKHGNRSVSSKSGSADVLEKLGIKVDLEPSKVEDCMNSINIGFMFAPLFHKSMKYAIGPRRELGIRTVFNILGPLTNPANAEGQLLGVFSKELVPVMAHVLNNLGVKHALVVHGSDGLDEITTTGDTYACEVKNGKVNELIISPKDYGIELCTAKDLEGGEAEENSKIIKDIFGGEKGAKRDIVALNAGAALYVANIVNSIEAGTEEAKEVIDSGKALEKVEEFAKFTQNCNN